jgi:hypothetical protein
MPTPLLALLVTSFAIMGLCLVQLVFAIARRRAPFAQYRGAIAVAAVFCPLLVLFSGACGPSTKPALRTADALLQDACEVLAQRMAERGNSDPQKIINVTCAVEGFTRTLREMLLSQQIEAARAAGVPVLFITSEQLEDDPARTMDAE